MSRIICITGTDTGVGKTFLTTLLLAHLRAQGVRALAMKPFCSGGTDDIEQIRAIQGDELPAGLLNPYHFHLPLAPYVAARKEGRRISLKHAIRAVQRASMMCDCLLVEGAGGALTPLTLRESFADMAALLGAEVILVGINKLGILNHALLTLESLRSREVSKLKVVLMEQQQKDDAASTNVVMLRKYVGKSGVFTLPRLRSDVLETREKVGGSKKIKKTLALIAAPDTFAPVVRDAAKRSETKS